ncbi:MAG TPA: hypothetical protein VFF39_19725 [Verrucomicrobiae bacterium]|nr:hypothetical protein [Verrucomicrobiae bacterium]
MKLSRRGLFRMLFSLPLVKVFRQHPPTLGGVRFMLNRNQPKERIDFITPNDWGHALGLDISSNQEKLRYFFVTKSGDLIQPSPNPRQVR